MAWGDESCQNIDPRLRDTLATTRSSATPVDLAIRNTCNVTAAEVVQCCIHAWVSEVCRPNQELKSVEKELLLQGETKRITLYLQGDAFHFHDTGWIAEEGKYEIGGCFSSRRLKKSFHRNSVVVELGDLECSLFGCCFEHFKTHSVRHMGGEKGGKDSKANKKMAASMLHRTPLRSLVLFSQGMLTCSQLNMNLSLVNLQHVKLFKLMFRKTPI